MLLRALSGRSHILSGFLRNGECSIGKGGLWFALLNEGSIRQGAHQGWTHSMSSLVILEETVLPIAAFGRARKTEGAQGSYNYLQHRYFAKRVLMKPPKQGIQAPPGAQRQVKISLPSPGVIGEPYKGKIKIPIKDYFGLVGWKRLFREKMLGTFKSIYTLAKCRSLLKWRMLDFKKESLSLYEEICSALAQGNLSELRQLTTPVIYSQMKNEIGQRERGGWKSVQWSLAQRPTLREVQIVQARLLGDPKNESMAFTQITVFFPSMQQFAAYGKDGKLVVGDPDSSINVRDFWVLERNMKKNDISARWRLAGRLPPPVS